MGYSITFQNLLRERPQEVEKVWTGNQSRFAWNRYLITYHNGGWSVERFNLISRIIRRIFGTASYSHKSTINTQLNREGIQIIGNRENIKSLVGNLLRIIQQPIIPTVTNENRTQAFLTIQTSINHYINQISAFQVDVGAKESVKDRFQYVIEPVKEDFRRLLPDMNELQQITDPQKLNSYLLEVNSRLYKMFESLPAFLGLESSMKSQVSESKLVGIPNYTGANCWFSTAWQVLAAARRLDYIFLRPLPKNTPDYDKLQALQTETMKYINLLRNGRIPSREELMAFGVAVGFTQERIAQPGATSDVLRKFNALTFPCEYIYPGMIFCMQTQWEFKASTIAVFNNGHYTSLIKCDNGKWYSIDDANISFFAENDAKTYERLKSSMPYYMEQFLLRYTTDQELLNCFKLLPS